MNNVNPDDIFLTDNEGRFIDLVIPATDVNDEICLTGKKRNELSLDEVISLKCYAQFIYGENEDEEE